MAIDIFGNTLYEGDVVVFSDRVGRKGVGMFVYEVDGIVGDNLVIGTSMAGDDIGETFYLQDTHERCSLIRNVYKTAEAFNETTIN